MLLWTLLTRLAGAHTGAAPMRGVEDWSHLPPLEPADAWIVWDFYPSIVIGTALLVGTYVLLAGPLRKRFGLAERGPGPWEWASFLGGVGVMFFALQGPLHELSDLYLFSGHMVQHLLITLVFPPLLILGIPGWMWKPLTRIGWVAKVGRALTHPVVAFTVSTGVLYLWHIPRMYDWALYDHNVHIAEHLLFMSSAVIMWWPVASRVDDIPPLTPGYRMVYLFLLTIPMKGLGAIITVSDYVLYRFYAVQPRVFGLDPLSDQRLGGVIMWMPGGLAIWFAMGVVFFTSFYADLMKERQGGQGPARGEGLATSPATDEASVPAVARTASDGAALEGA